MVKQSARMLRGAVGVYAFVSTISVYADTSTPGQDESAPLAALTDESVEDVTGETYGGLKVLCERVVQEEMRERALILRPGLIVGPYDPTDRFTYWPHRVAGGGEVLSPGRPGRAVQFIDARDLADFILAAVARGLAGPYNVTGPQEPVAIGSVLDACKQESGSDARFLGLPDQGLTSLLLGDAPKPVARIRQMIVDWTPTHLVVPSILDAHPDHSALAVLTQFAVADLPNLPTRPVMFCFVVHNNHKEFPFQIVISPRNDRETFTKRQAIAQHHTQVRFSRRRFMAYADRTEGFHLINHAQVLAMNSIGPVRRTSTELGLRVPFRRLPVQDGLVCVSGYGHGGLPVSICRPLSECNLGAQTAEGRRFRRIAGANDRRGPVTVELTFPTAEFDPNRPLFAKLKHGRGFFDQGWIEIPALPAGRIASPSPAGFSSTSPASEALEARK